MDQKQLEEVWRNEFDAYMENEALNRQLCEMVFVVENQDQVLEEWNGLEQEVIVERPGHCCEHCGKSFTRVDNLKRHVKSNHSGERRFSCQECNKPFATKDKLKRHEKNHQAKQHECSRCHKKFGRKDKLNDHIKTHERRAAEREYTCNECGEMFRNIFPFQAHMKTHDQVGGGKTFPRVVDNTMVIKRVIPLETWVTTNRK